VKPYYQDDFATIYHGDCREILPQLPKVDLVLTDPPYGINFAGQPTKWQRLSGQKPERWDESVFSDNELKAVLSWGEHQIVWGGNYYRLEPSRCWLAWVKPDAPPSMGSVEFAWTSFDANARQITHSISATNPERVGHPTQKPLRVTAWSLHQALNTPLTILDPFMGSGTTLVAAKQLGRKSIGIELEEKYCEIAARRLQQEYLPLQVQQAPKIQEEALL
jgi:site-specific DNA-methyltransferase (adenine-specific)